MKQINSTNYFLSPTGEIFKIGINKKVEEVKKLMKLYTYKGHPRIVLRVSGKQQLVYPNKLLKSLYPTNEKIRNTNQAI